MRFDDSRVDSSRLDDRRGTRISGAGAGIGGLGGLGLIGVVLWLIFGGGGDPSALLTQDSISSTTTASSGQNLSVTCASAEALENRRECLVLKVFNETDEVWGDFFAAQGQAYPEPTLVYFSDSVRTQGCGSASAAAGPFYCPADRSVYLDLDFLAQLQQQYGLPGNYATAYIVAHEVGHHIQNITGIESQVRAQQQRNPSRANEYSVALELQADCLAGVWGRRANDGGNVVISPTEYQQAITAAAAVGDDRIMAGSGLRVNPEAFTHGSSAQRQEWFTKGFQSGDPASCNFGA
ncbi:MAG: neutral zinc metallopeptidase [Actinobacteria bacterium]|nr:neutral zinc metallopeptidase [Actinomycetota bacterium]